MYEIIKSNKRISRSYTATEPETECLLIQGPVIDMRRDCLINIVTYIQIKPQRATKYDLTLISELNHAFNEKQSV